MGPKLFRKDRRGFMEERFKDNWSKRVERVSFFNTVQIKKVINQTREANGLSMNNG